ncbi:ETEC_3214 domain-containing protein [Vibrio ponticus]|uniref:ETEC_3214 domain-containing protein n=1 Tax=Vibrio ponticus TaxID=265668 RepID=UPI00161B6B11|nr:ETEC_3214 domain-containing protein [Vibrio ponticus]
MSNTDASQQASNTQNNINIREKVREKWAKTIAFVSIVVIALGGINDSWDAVEKMSNFALSQFTDIPSHNKLEHIYIRSSKAVLEEHFGAPVYIKEDVKGRSIEYYDDKRFILSAVTQDNAIVAFLVFPKEGFTPNTNEHSSGNALLDVTFSNNIGVNDVRVNYSPSVSYYIESNSGGEFSNLYNSISGFSETISALDTETRNKLKKISDGLMMAHNMNNEIIEFRESVVPNFYGYSILGLGPLENAILTFTEFRLISN